MEQTLTIWAECIALLVESIAVGIVAFGAVEAFGRLLQPVFDWPPHVGWHKAIWVEFGSATRARRRHRGSAIAATWEDLGFLAAIAAIRTFLNYFSEKDIEEARPALGRERIEA